MSGEKPAAGDNIRSRIPGHRDFTTSASLSRRLGRPKRIRLKKKKNSTRKATTSCCRGNSGVLANQQGHGQRIPHRRTSLTRECGRSHIATVLTEETPQIWPRTEQRPAGRKDARRSETPVARRARAQEDPNRNEEPQISSIPAADTERKPRGAIKSRRSRQKIHRHRQLTTPTSSGSARTESARRRKKGPKKGPFVWSFRSTGAASHGVSGNRPASPSDTVTSGGSAGRADICRNRCRTLCLRRFGGAASGRHPSHRLGEAVCQRAGFEERRRAPRSSIAQGGGGRTQLGERAEQHAKGVGRTVAPLVRRKPRISRA
ncbi:hypothetical protein pipiens_011841 [Culex pipiens pipiens]|uniref:Uncharacterized protein n=1 Tax=Culex pipiens pipiens TaxID=38569 RepID=A0ABD1D4Q3_CULPP